MEQIFTNSRRIVGVDASQSMIEKAKEEFDSLKQDGKEQYLAELRMKHILDTNNIKQTGFRQGLEE